MNTWEIAQQWESSWHGNCANSLNEELKQLVYAEKMGILFTPNNKTPYNIDLAGKTVIDFGGGPYSMLLKASNGYGFVVDPLPVPEWVIERYRSASIVHIPEKAEEFEGGGLIYDELWMYNLLQHVDDPQKVIANAQRMAKVIRIFDWIDTPINEGHLHTLTAANLDTWLNGQGMVEHIDRSGAVGFAYFGVFKGDHYAEV